MEPETGTLAYEHGDPLVLVVEDSVLVAMAIEDALLEKGLTVVVATSLAAAEQVVALDAPAVALLDLQLPDGYSLDLASRLNDMGCAVAITSGLDSGAVPHSHRFAVQFRKPTSPDLLADWTVSVLKSLPRSSPRPVEISSCSQRGTG